MAYDIKIKKIAINLRKKGYSLLEIAKEIGISKGTASLWVRSIELNSQAIKRLDLISHQSFLKSKNTRDQKSKKANELLNIKISKLLKNITLDKNILKVIAAVLFWGEGNKSGSYMSFINSDPEMINCYLNLLRKSFSIDEKKLRALVHIHEYHNKKEIVEYWSKIANIPIAQFSKCYLKPHTGKRKRAGYKGSIRIRYYDSNLKDELRAIYTLLPTIFDNKGR